MMNGRGSVLNPTVAGFISLLVLALSSGCAYQRIDTLSQKMADQQRQINALQRENIEMKSRMEEQKTTSFLIDKRLKENNDRVGDIQARLQSLEIRQGETKGSLDEVRASLERRPPSVVAPAVVPSPLTPTAEVPPAKAVPGAPGVSAPLSPPQPEPKMIQPAPPRLGALGSQELYEGAMKLLKAGEPGQAILEFERYIQEFPHSELADNAQYWIGESYYSQREFSRALIEFQKVLSNFPQADKVPDALLKIGLSYLEMGQKEKGTAELKRLITKYPDSPPASLARKKLAELSR